jgi:hypothetical protein
MCAIRAPQDVRDPGAPRCARPNRERPTHQRARQPFGSTAATFFAAGLVTELDGKTVEQVSRAATPARPSRVIEFC